MVRFCHLTLIVAVLLTGCLHRPRICLSPPYDVPAGFSETYAAALNRSGPTFATESTGFGGSWVGPPIWIWPQFGLFGVSADEFPTMKQAEGRCDRVSF